MPSQLPFAAKLLVLVTRLDGWGRGIKDSRARESPKSRRKSKLEQNTGKKEVMEQSIGTVHVPCMLNGSGSRDTVNICPL